MRLFIYEYTCACPAFSALPISLRAEGLAMLSAVLADFGRMDGVETGALLAEEAPMVLADTVCRTGADEESAFRALAARADYTLVIAPEFDDILVTRCQWAEESGGRTLNSTLDAIRLTADKYALAQQLRAHQVPTPPTYPFPYFPALANLILKPRFGAGSQATFVRVGAHEFHGCVAQARAEGFTGEMIVQPYVPGLAASVALLNGPVQRVALWPAAQHLTSDGRCRYLGGSVPLPERYWRRALALAERAVACVPGLRGFVGVDLVLGDAIDGSGDVVIEINPRLTTSYIGLRQLVAANLAALMLAVAEGKQVQVAMEAESGLPVRVPGVETIHFAAEDNACGRG